mgnify:CR=1 FL=1
MRARGAETIAGGVLRLANGEWPAAILTSSEAKDTEAALPAWANIAAPEAQRPAQPLSPSDLGGAKALPGESLSLTEDQAKARGTAVHLLLEHLPAFAPADWPSAAANLIPDATLCSDALEEAQRLLQTSDLAWLFTPDSLAEAPFCARIGSSLISGSIDRLIVTADRITIVDFKSNTVVPKSADQVPEGILRQMGAYVAALRQVYPGRSVQPFILWTRSAQLMPLAPDIVSAALDRAAIP